MAFGKYTSYSGSNFKFRNNPVSSVATTIEAVNDPLPSSSQSSDDLSEATEDPIENGSSREQKTLLQELQDDPAGDPGLLDATRIAAECPIFGNLVPNVYIDQIEIEESPEVNIRLKMLDLRNEQGMYSIIGNESLEQYLKVVCVLSDSNQLTLAIKAIFNARLHRDPTWRWTTAEIEAATAPNNPHGIPASSRYIASIPTGANIGTKIVGMPLRQTKYASEFFLYSQLDSSSSIMLWSKFKFDLTQGNQPQELTDKWTCQEFPYLACFFYAQLDTQKITNEIGGVVPNQFMNLSSEYAHEVFIQNSSAQNPQLESYSYSGNTTSVINPNTGTSHAHPYTMDDSGNGMAGDHPAIGINHKHIVSNFKVSHDQGHIHEIPKVMAPVDNVLDYRIAGICAATPAAETNTDDAPSCRPNPAPSAPPPPLPTYLLFFFFLSDTCFIYTVCLLDALPIWQACGPPGAAIAVGPDLRQH